MKIHHKFLSRSLTIVILSAALVSQLFLPALANAAQITSRSLTLVSGTTDAGAKASGVVNHSFTFSIPTAGTIGSIQFLYCTLASGTCVTPSGLTTTSATLGSDTGVATGFTSVVNTTNGAPYITRAAAASASGSETVVINSVTNPSTENQTFYVRIATFTTTNATGSPTDTGNVAASTTRQIVLTGTMPESLVFCAGATISTTATVPDCSTASSGAVSFNQLFSPTDTATATSQMAASTNAGTGYTITVNGPTLTSGGNTIAGMSSATTTIHGIPQFGLNLKANTVATSTVAVGTEVAPTSDGITYKGEALAGYNTVDTFKFNNGDAVADSKYSGAGGSNAQIYTVSYIANVPGNQPAGSYTTTLTYICTPTY
jgi:hypothetical protein